MCIAIFSPENTAIPSEAYLRNSFKNNPDGAGWAYYDKRDNLVHIRKGFMEENSFINDIKSIAEEVDLTEAVCQFHCRIGTHGAMDARATHPFPVTNKDEALTSLRAKCKVSLIHNGILSDWTNDPNKDLSDTMIYTKYMMYPLSRVSDNWVSDEHTWRAIEMSKSTSKICIMSGDGWYCSSGFTKASDGNYYSNTSYLPSYNKWQKKFSMYYNDYDYDYYDDYYKSLAEKLPVPRGKSATVEVVKYGEAKNIALNVDDMDNEVFIENLGRDFSFVYLRNPSTAAYTYLGRFANCTIINDKGEMTVYHDTKEDKNELRSYLGGKKTEKTKSDKKSGKKEGEKDGKKSEKEEEEYVSQTVVHAKCENLDHVTVFCANESKTCVSSIEGKEISYREDKNGFIVSEIALLDSTRAEPRIGFIFKVTYNYIFDGISYEMTFSDRDEMVMLLKGHDAISDDGEMLRIDGTCDFDGYEDLTVQYSPVQSLV